MKLKLRTAERVEGELRIRIYELHTSYTQRLVQSLIDRAIELARGGKPEPFRVLLLDKQRLELLPDQFARLETLCIMDEELSAPPARGTDWVDGEGPEAP